MTNVSYTIDMTKSLIFYYGQYGQKVLYFHFLISHAVYADSLRMQGSGKDTNNADWKAISTNVARDNDLDLSTVTKFDASCRNKLNALKKVYHQYVWLLTKVSGLELSEVDDDRWSTLLQESGKTGDAARAFKDRQPFAFYEEMNAVMGGTAATGANVASPNVLFGNNNGNNNNNSKAHNSGTAVTSAHKRSSAASAAPREGAAKKAKGAAVELADDDDDDVDDDGAGVHENLAVKLEHPQPASASPAVKHPVKGALPLSPSFAGGKPTPGSKPKQGKHESEITFNGKDLVDASRFLAQSGPVPEAEQQRKLAAQVASVIAKLLEATLIQPAAAATAIKHYCAPANINEAAAFVASSEQIQLLLVSTL